MIFIYCSGQHWSDECQMFPAETARKEKIKGHCVICLKQGHHRNIVSASRSSQLRSPLKLQILIWTIICYYCYRTYLAVHWWTSTDKKWHRWKNGKVATWLLLGKGSQRTYITNEQYHRIRDTHTPVTELRLLPKDGSSLRLRVNVVPKITGNLQRAYFIQRNAIIYLGTFHLPIQYPQIKKLPT